MRLYTLGGMNRTVLDGRLYYGTHEAAEQQVMAKTHEKEQDEKSVSAGTDPFLSVLFLDNKAQAGPCKWPRSP